MSCSTQNRSLDLVEGVWHWFVWVVRFCLVSHILHILLQDCHCGWPVTIFGCMASRLSMNMAIATQWEQTLCVP